LGSKALITRTRLNSENGEEITMCEFNVILNGKTQFKDAVYAKVEGNNVTVKNILGEAKEFKNCKITEVDVNATRLVLSTLKL
jgi:predicted RNA-binding protein